MSASPRLSIVLPVYGVAKFLPACLDSLAAQTLPADEIIAVDDGGIDDCPRILADYQQRMPNLRVIRRENGGLSAARNTGLDAAKGRWLIFIDSDDFIEPDMFARLVTMVEQDDLDMGVCNAWYHFEGRRPERLIHPDTADEGVTAGDAWLLSRLKARHLPHMVWMHIYRRDFIEQNRFRFVPGLVHEDVVWTTQALLKAGRVRFNSAPLYHYRIAERRFDEEALIRRLERVIDSSIYNARALAELADALPPTSDLRTAIHWQLVDGAFSVFHLTEKLPRPDLRSKRWLQLRRESFYRFLFAHAATWRQRRKILGRYLKHGVLPA